MATVSDLHAPALHRKVVLHGHCHRTSVLGMDGELAVLAALGGGWVARRIAQRTRGAD